MAKFTHTDVLDQGPQHIITLAGTASQVKQHLVSAYTATDSYATVVTNSLGVVDMVAGDFTLAAYSTTGRKMTVGAKSSVTATASSATPNLHLVLVDSVGSTVLLATDETTDQAITAPNPVDLPTWDYNLPQPV
jgi:hypothetical protein